MSIYNFTLRLAQLLNLLISDLPRHFKIIERVAARATYAEINIAAGTWIAASRRFLNGDHARRNFSSVPLPLHFAKLVPPRKRAVLINYAITFRYAHTFLHLFFPRDISVHTAYTSIGGIPHRSQIGRESFSRGVFEIKALPGFFRPIFLTASAFTCWIFRSGKTCARLEVFLAAGFSL